MGAGPQSLAGQAGEHPLHSFRDRHQNHHTNITLNFPTLHRPWKSPDQLAKRRKPDWQAYMASKANCMASRKGEMQEAVEEVPLSQQDAMQMLPCTAVMGTHDPRHLSTYPGTGSPVSFCDLH